MFRYSLIITLLLTVYTAEARRNRTKPINKDMTKKIRKQKEWVPYEPEENPFANYTIDELFAMVGTNIPEPDNSTNATAQSTNASTTNDTTGDSGRNL